MVGLGQREIALRADVEPVGFASVAAVVGIAVGIPLGIIAGRWLWDLFARQIYAVPYPTVSVPSVLLVAVGTLVLANLVAAVPARTAARTPTAFMLRAE